MTDCRMKHGQCRGLETLFDTFAVRSGLEPSLDPYNYDTHTMVANH